MRRAGAVIAVCAAFALAAAVSGPIVAAAERLVGVKATTTPTIAWFADPNLADQGFPTSSHQVAVVVPSSTGLIHLSERCGTSVVDAWSANGTQGRPLHLPLVVPARCAGSWMTLHVQGTLAPLQAWVR